MDVRVFNGEKVNVGDEVAYPSRGDDGKTFMRKTKIVEITQQTAGAGRVSTKIVVGSGYWGRVVLHNHRTIVKL